MRRLQLIRSLCSLLSGGLCGFWWFGVKLLMVSWLHNLVGEYVCYLINDYNYALINGTRRTRIVALHHLAISRQHSCSLDPLWRLSVCNYGYTVILHGQAVCKMRICRLLRLAINSLLSKVPSHSTGFWVSPQFLMILRQSNPCSSSSHPTYVNLCCTV